MPLRKDNPILSPVNGFLVDLPSPSNISYFWNFGSLLGLCLVLQIITGCFLSMHYCSDACLAFASIGHIMRDVNYGFLLRYLHANGASLFFFLPLYSYWTRVILRGVFEIPCLECWSFAFFIDYGDCFYGLCFALGPNVFLGRDCYYEFIICNTLFWGGYCSMGLRWF